MINHCDMEDFNKRMQVSSDTNCFRAMKIYFYLKYFYNYSLRNKDAKTQYNIMQSVRKSRKAVVKSMPIKPRR